VGCSTFGACVQCVQRLGRTSFEKEMIG
jgi:hypothetical protein